jgi:hypothetical protein
MMRYAPKREGHYLLGEREKIKAMDAKLKIKTSSSRIKEKML